MTPTCQVELGRRHLRRSRRPSRAPRRRNRGRRTVASPGRHRDTQRPHPGSARDSEWRSTRAVALQALEDHLEPELHLGSTPGAGYRGWRLARMPRLPQTAHFPLAPDWVCEVLSVRRRDSIGPGNCHCTRSTASVMPGSSTRSSGRWKCCDSTLGGGRCPTRAQGRVGASRAFEDLELRLGELWTGRWCRRQQTAGRSEWPISATVPANDSPLFSAARAGIRAAARNHRARVRKLGEWHGPAALLGATVSLGYVAWSSGVRVSVADMKHPSVQADAGRRAYACQGATALTALLLRRTTRFGPRCSWDSEHSSSAAGTPAGGGRPRTGAFYSTGYT